MVFIPPVYDVDWLVYKYGLEPNDLQLNQYEWYVVNEEDITEEEIKFGIKPGDLAIETTEWNQETTNRAKEYDNFVGVLNKGNGLRCYYFRED